METVISIVGATISLSAAIFTYFQVKVAKRSLHQASIIKFFSAFDATSQVTITKPELLYSVHGLNKSIPQEEAINIAYLCMLLDAYQHFYGERYYWNFSKMEAALKKESTFLNKILAVKDNQNRLEELKRLYYGEFDAGFLRAIEALIKHENEKNQQR